MFIMWLSGQDTGNHSREEDCLGDRNITQDMIALFFDLIIHLQKTSHVILPRDSAPHMMKNQ
jgi:hypothetical protein